MGIIGRRSGLASRVILLAQNFFQIVRDRYPVPNLRTVNILFLSVFLNNCQVVARSVGLLDFRLCFCFCKSSYHNTIHICPRHKLRRVICQSSKAECERQNRHRSQSS